MENGVLPDEQFFIHYPDKEIVDLSVTLLATKYTLSENWYEMHKILVPDEQVNMKATILGAIFHLKKHKVGKILDGLRGELQKAESEADTEIFAEPVYAHEEGGEKHFRLFRLSNFEIMAQHLDLGRKGESLAKTFLEDAGYEILDENWTHGKCRDRSYRL